MIVFEDLFSDQSNYVVACLGELVFNIDFVAFKTGMNRVSFFRLLF